MVGACGIALARSGGSEHAFEDRIDVPEMVVEVEIGFELLFRELGPHVLVGLKQRKEIAFALHTFMALRCTRR